MAVASLLLSLAVSLRSTASLPAGATVRVGDVAAVTGDGAEAARAIPLPVDAPRPGLFTTITATRLVDRLRAAGFQQVTIDGAESVQVVGVGQPLDRVQVRRAIERLIAAQAGPEQITLKSVGEIPLIGWPVGDDDLDALPPPPGLQAGVQRITLRWRRADDRRRSITVPIELEITGPLLVAARDLDRGQPLGPDDLREEIRLYPRGTAVLRQLVAGAQTRRAIRSGELLLARDVRGAAAVEPGQRIRARVVEGVVTLALETIARGRGEIGDVVVVGGADGRPLRARVIARGDVLVLGSQPTGARWGEKK